MYCKDQCFENIDLHPIFPCKEECEENYYEILNCAVKSAKILRKTVETVYLISDYCKEQEKVILGLSAAVEELRVIRKLIDKLLIKFRLEFFECDLVYPGLVRAFVIAKFVQRLYCYLLEIDLFDDEERLLFLLDSLRRSSIDADIILNELLLAENTFVGGCK